MPLLNVDVEKLFGFTKRLIHTKHNQKKKTFSNLKSCFYSVPVSHNQAISVRHHRLLFQMTLISTALIVNCLLLAVDFSPLHFSIYSLSFVELSLLSRIFFRYDKTLVFAKRSSCSPNGCLIVSANTLISYVVLLTNKICNITFSTCYLASYAAKSSMITMFQYLHRLLVTVMKI